MIANWMLYCVAVGVLLSGGAAALEAALRPLGRPTRWVWAAALLLTITAPVAARFAGTLTPEAAAMVPDRGGDAGVTVTTGAAPSQDPAWLRRLLDAERLQAPLAVLWGASSAGVVLALAGMAGALQRRRRAWATAEVDGVPVLVSPDVGPAVVGLVRSRIVLPRWTMEADKRARALVLEHEQEHVRAGDPRLLAMALAGTILTPWNPAVWWQLRRLRLAVEVDCDSRVLRRRGDVHAYGSVLLEVGRRAAHTRLAAAAAFSEPVSSLERRIRIMTAPRVRRPFLRAAGFVAVAVALAVGACEAPVPTQPSSGGTRVAYRSADGTTERIEGPRSHLSASEAVNQYFPEVAREGMGTNEVLVFVLDKKGDVVRHVRSDRIQSPSLVAVLNDLPASDIETVNVTKLPAGNLAPTPVQIVWVQVKGEGGHGRSASAPASGAAEFTGVVVRRNP
jgi:beta-lactamase regulating signal transducer with metallopeptidase domain